MLLSALFSALAFGESSCRSFALAIGVTSNVAISRVAVWRFLAKPAMVTFLEGLIARATKEAYKAHDQSVLKTADNTKQILEGVNRIILGDSMSICMHPSLHWIFPGSVNQTDVKKSHLKLQLAIDLLTGQFIDFSIDAYQRSDMRAAFDILPKLVKGDLLIRDLGYNQMEVFFELIKKEVFFVSRLMTKHNVYDTEGNKLDLAKVLSKKKLKSGQSTRFGILMSKKHKLPCDLVAVKVPEEISNLRRARLKAKHAEQGWPTPSKKYLALQDWTLIVTNLPEETADNEKIRELYMMRWRIEIVFKACKSHTGLLKIAQHKTNPNHAKALILGWLLLMVMMARHGAFSMARLREIQCSKTHECYQYLEIHNLSLLKSLQKRVYSMGFYIELIGCNTDIHEHWERTSKFEEIHNCTDLYLKRISQSECLAAILETEKVGGLC